MAHIIGIALTIAITYWLAHKARGLPNAVKNVFVIGGGFFLLALQIGVITLMIGGILTAPGRSFWDIVVFSIVMAMLMVWNAFLSLNIAQRLMLMGLYKGMREQQWQAAPPYGGGTNPRVSWKDYQG